MSSVTDFVSSLGINTHMDATSTGYANVSQVATDLAYLGINNIRDHAWDVDLAAYRKLAAAGIKFDLIVDGDAAASTAAMVPVRASIIAFEGANEVDVNPVVIAGIKSPVAAAVAEQKALYAAVKTNPLLSAIPVLNQSVGDPNNYLTYAATTAFSDVANMHAYAAWGDAPRYVLPIRVQTESLAGKPSVITETGYFTMLNKAVDPSGVTENVQARLTLDTIFDSFAAGIAHTFLYELLDEAPDPAGTNAELHYGLFHADGTPKLAATAIHNMTTILGLRGTATPALSPSFSGMPENSNHLTLSGANGSTFISIWAEPQLWNTAAQTENPVATSHVAVSLGALVGTVSVFDPMVGTTAIATYSNVSQVTVDVTDHPLIIQASGVGTVPVTPPVPAPSLTPAAMRDKLAAPAGNRLLDAANGMVMSGSNTRVTSFFVDAATAPKSVVTNMHVGDSVTLWAFTGNSNALVWKSNQSQFGYTGATLQATTTHGAAAITFSAATLKEVHTTFGVTTGSVNGMSYLRLTETK